VVPDLGGGRGGFQQPPELPQESQGILSIFHSPPVPYQLRCTTTAGTHLARGHGGHEAGVLVPRKIARRPVTRHHTQARGRCHVQPARAPEAHPLVRAHLQGSRVT
jgi:hypothetical protein